jgi:hypothetical protein
MNHCLKTLKLKIIRRHCGLLYEENLGDGERRLYIHRIVLDSQFKNNNNNKEQKIKRGKKEQTNRNNYIVRGEMIMMMTTPWGLEARFYIHLYTHQRA